MTLRDEDGCDACLVANSEPIDVPNFNGLSLVLEQPIFFCRRARLVATQRQAQPVLLLTQHDWQQLRREQITHAGAFGSDHAVLSAHQIAERFVPGHSSYDPRGVVGGSEPGDVWVCHACGGRQFYRRPRDDASVTLEAPPAGANVHTKEERGADDARWFEQHWARLVGGGHQPSQRQAQPQAQAQPQPGGVSDWVAVWKFPGDLNSIPTFRAIESIPLPVGCYGFQDDGWWVPSQLPPLPPALPLNGCAVEKMRIDLPGGGCVHHLERAGDSSAQVAAISSGYFIEGYWNQHPATLPQIVEMLQQLHEAGVYAFPCYGQHHAIVFYADLAVQPVDVLSPRLFCERVLAREPRRSAVLGALRRAAFPEKHASLSRWVDNYLRVYSAPADHTQCASRPSS